MKKNSTKRDEEKKKKKSFLEQEIESLVYNSMKACLDRAIDDLLKDWK